MGLREWLMILGGLVLLLIIADGIRRMRKVDNQDQLIDEEEKARQEQLRRELPAGGARVVKSHEVDVFDDDPIPVLSREVEIPEDYATQSSRFAGYNAEDKGVVGEALHSDLASQYDTDAVYNADAGLDTREAVQDLSAATDKDADLWTEQQLPANADEPDYQLLSGDQGAPVSVEHANTEMPFYDEQDESADRLSSDAEDLTAGYRQSVADGMTHAGMAQDEYPVTHSAPVDDPLDDLEPPEPLEKRFAAEKARRLAERQREQETAQVEAEAAALEAIDPVKAAVRRIQGKHTGPRPSERIKMQAPEPEESLAERQYRQQQAEEQQKAAQHRALQEARAKAEAEAQREAAEKRAALKRKPLLTADQERDQIASASELLLMHVKCKDERGFHGSALMHVVMQCGMQLGDMKVFHRFVKTEDGPQIQFSMLSSVDPGVFDVDQLDELYIPSVSFVMGLPAPGNSHECFTMMLETAKVIVRHLHGELRDENRSVMTPQTIEHYKQRIQDFERRKQLARMR